MDHSCVNATNGRPPTQYTYYHTIIYNLHMLSTPSAPSSWSKKNELLMYILYLQEEEKNAGHLNSTSDLAPHCWFAFLGSPLLSTNQAIQSLQRSTNPAKNLKGQGARRAFRTSGSAAFSRLSSASYCGIPKRREKQTGAFQSAGVTGPKEHVPC